MQSSPVHLVEVLHLLVVNLLQQKRKKRKRKKMLIWVVSLVMTIDLVVRIIKNK